MTTLAALRDQDNRRPDGTRHKRRFDNTTFCRILQVKGQS